jgi:hypothetical protein
VRCPGLCDVLRVPMMRSCETVRPRVSLTSNQRTMGIECRISICASKPQHAPCHSTKYLRLATPMAAACTAVQLRLCHFFQCPGPCLFPLSLDRPWQYSVLRTSVFAWFHRLHLLLLIAHGPEILTGSSAFSISNLQGPPWGWNQKTTSYLRSRRRNSRNRHRRHTSS